MDLSRRFDGSIGIAGMTDRYDKSVTDENKDGIDFGTYFALTYTLPRKQQHADDTVGGDDGTRGVCIPTPCHYQHHDPGDRAHGDLEHGRSERVPDVETLVVDVGAGFHRVVIRGKCLRGV